VIVLFTDGAPNTFSGSFSRRTANNHTAATLPDPILGAMHISDFPDVGGTSTNDPYSRGLFNAVTYGTSTLTNEASCRSGLGNSGCNNECWAPACGDDGDGSLYNQESARIPGIPFFGPQSNHNQPGGAPRSSGIPTAFDLHTPGLSGQRTFLASTVTTLAPQYPYMSHPNNISKAARNLAERIAHEIRSDSSGAHPIHIYTLGLGQLLNLNQGVQPAETGSNILRRIANDPASGSFNSTQPEGKYYFAGSATELNDAFQQIRDQIIRISE
jgi:hypothetical protein